MHGLFLIGICLFSLVFKCNANCNCSYIRADFEREGSVLCNCTGYLSKYGQCVLECKYVKRKNDATKLSQLLPPAGVHSLTILDYDDTELPALFLSDKRVHNLIIAQSSKLQTISDTTFADSSVGEELKLQDLKQLSSVHSMAFNKLTSLATIKIINCTSLQTGDFNFTNIRLLQKIVITGTAIQFMTMPRLNEDIDEYEQLVHLELTRNQLICNCSMKWIKTEPWKSSIVDCVEPNKPHGPEEITAKDFAYCFQTPSVASRNTICFFGQLMSMSVFLINI